MPICKAIWTDGVRFLHTSSSGHALVTDAPETVGGGNSAPTPMELVLHALIGCQGVDLAMMLNKMKQPFTNLEITAEAERRDEHPRIYKNIALHVTIRGEVSEKKLLRAMDLSLNTYCSVAGMIQDTTAITQTHTILK